jgi:hypothetical protein
MTAIRIEHRKPSAAAPVTPESAPPEWKWDTLPVLKEVIEADDEPTADQPPTVEATE